MRRELSVAVGAAAVVGALVGAGGLPVRAQPVASISLPPPATTRQLFPGCNNIALTFPDGTASQTVVEAVAPGGTVESLWRHNAALKKFDGFSPMAPQASDLLTVNFLNAVWLCVSGEGPPAPTPTPPVPTATLAPAPAPTATPPVEAGQATTVFNGQGDKDTTSFDVVYGPFAIKWTTESATPEYATLAFLIFAESETVSYVCIADFDGVGSDSTVCHVPAGRYWISVIAANLTSWRIEVEPPPPTSAVPATFTGRGDKDTPTFHIDGQSFTVAWTTESGSPQYASLAFLIYPEGETIGYVCTAAFDGIGSDTTACHAGPGDFHAEVLAANLSSWSLYVTQ